MVSQSRRQQPASSSFRAPLVTIWGVGQETCRRIRELAAERQLPVRIVDNAEFEGGQIADIALVPVRPLSSDPLHGALEAILTATSLRPGEYATVDQWRAIRLAARVQSVAAGEKRELQSVRMPDGSYALVAGSIEWRTWSEKLAKRVLCWVKTTSFADTLLIVGPTGTGKTLLAKLVHEATARKGGKLVRLGSEILKQGILQAELFGTVAGAYTGATEGKPGLVEIAKGGTMLLDELDAYSRGAQPGLYRFVDRREFERMGSDETRVAPCTVIVCCNRPISSLLETGQLTLQLYERLAGNQITIPPLSERKKDIAGFICYELARLAAKTGKRCRLTKKALTYLQSLKWEGNVRELSRAIRTLWALNETSVVDFADVLAVVEGGRLSDAICQAVKEGRPMSDIMTILDRFLLMRAIVHNNGNVSAAARELSMRRDTFYRRARNAGIDISKIRKLLRGQDAARKDRDNKARKARRKDGTQQRQRGDRRKTEDASRTQRKQKPEADPKAKDRSKNPPNRNRKGKGGNNGKGRRKRR